MAKKSGLMGNAASKVKPKKMKPEADSSRGYLAGLSQDHARSGYRSLGSAGATSSDKMVPGQEQMQKVASSLDQVAKKPKA